MSEQSPSSKTTRKTRFAVLVALLVALIVPSQANAANICTATGFLEAYKNYYDRKRDSSAARRNLIGNFNNNLKVTKTFVGFGTDFLDGNFPKEVTRVLDTGKRQYFISSNPAKSHTIREMMKSVDLVNQPAPKVFTHGMEYLAAFASIWFTGEQILYAIRSGESDAYLIAEKDAAETSASLVIAFRGWQGLRITANIVGFLDVAINLFAQKAISINKDYWWEAYTRYLNTSYKTMVNGPNSWATLAERNDGGKAFQERLMEFWKAEPTNDGIETPALRAAHYYKKPGLLESDGPATFSDNYRKSMSTQYYVEFIKPTLDAYFLRKTEALNLDIQHRLNTALPRLCKLIEDIKGFEREMAAIVRAAELDEQEAAAKAKDKESADEKPKKEEAKKEQPSDSSETDAEKETETAALSPAEDAKSKEEISIRFAPQLGQIRVTKGQYAGPPLGGNRTVSNGDILAFQIDIAHLGGEETTVLENLSWQLFGPDDQPVDGVSKVRQLSSSGNVGKVDCATDSSSIGCFRFRLDDLANGAYKVAFTHQNAEDPGQVDQAVVGFKLYQSVKLDRLVVDVSPEGQSHREVLYLDQAPHLFAYYELGKGVDQVKANISVVEQGSGRVLHAESLTRPRKGSNNKQRVGLRLDPGMLKVGQKALFMVTLAGPDGKPVAQSESFTVSAYKIALDVPQNVKSGKKHNFAIRVPDNFQAPYRVNLDFPTGLSLQHSPGKLTGRVTGIAGDHPIKTKLSATVIDSKGRKGSTSVSIRIAAKSKASPPPTLGSAPTQQKSASNCHPPNFRKVATRIIAEVKKVYFGSLTEYEERKPHEWTCETLRKDEALWEIYVHYSATGYTDPAAIAAYKRKATNNVAAVKRELSQQFAWCEQRGWPECK